MRHDSHLDDKMSIWDLNTVFGRSIMIKTSIIIVYTSYKSSECHVYYINQKYLGGLYEFSTCIEKVNRGGGGRDSYTAPE